MNVVNGIKSIVPTSIVIQECVYFPFRVFDHFIVVSLSVCLTVTLPVFVQCVLCVLVSMPVCLPAHQFYLNFFMGSFCVFVY